MNLSDTLEAWRSRLSGRAPQSAQRVPQSASTAASPAPSDALDLGHLHPDRRAFRLDVRTSHLQGLRPTPATGPQLTAAALEAWVEACGPFSFETGERQEVQRRILAAATTGPSGQLRIANLVLRHLDSDYSTPNRPAFGFHRLKSLPPGLRVEGVLVIDLPQVKRLPDGLQAQALRLFNCHKLEALPAGLRVEHDLVLSNCSNIARIPADIVIGGDLAIYRCPKLVHLPGHEQVMGAFMLGHPVDADYQVLLNARSQSEESDVDGQMVVAVRRQRPGHDTAFRSLPSKDVPDTVLATGTCPISLEPLADIDEVVFWQRNNHIVGAEFGALMKWWTVHGNDPVSRQELAIGDFFRRTSPKA